VNQRLVLQAAGVAAAALMMAATVAANDRPAATAPEFRAPASTASSTNWAALKSDQKVALAPLERDWSSIDGVRQKKWLELAARFPAMPEAERLRIQERMAQWAGLTPAKRNQARLQFLEAQQLPVEQRQARWQEYQALSADEKQALARQARQPVAAAAAPSRLGAGSGDGSAAAGKENMVKAPAPAIARSSTPTTLQAKPGATTRPLTTPASPPAHHQTGLPKIVATEGFVDPNTLLPKRGPQGAAVRSALTDGPTPKP
jgi:Protein of unknown function (DUF3106)